MSNSEVVELHAGAQCPIRPIEFNLVVKPEEAKEKTAGGVFIPEEVKDREQYGHQFGVVVAVSGNAFTEDGEKWPDAPEPGDRVMFVRYAGTLEESLEGGPYRVMKDKDVLGVINE